MARFRSLAPLLSLLAVLALTPVARADDADVDGFEPAPDQLGFTGFPGTRTPGPWGVDGTLWLDYGLRTVEPKTLGPAGGLAIDHRLAGTLSAQLGILSRGALALRVPLLLAQDGQRPGTGPSVFAVGSPSLDGRVRVLGAPVRPDGSVKDGAALALRGVFWFPIHSETTFFTEKSVRAELSLLADVETFGIGAGLSVGYRYRAHDVTLGDAHLRDQLRLAAGVRVPLPLLSRLKPGKLQEAALVEIDAATDPQDFFKRVTTPIEVRASYRVIVGDLFLTAGVGAGLLGAVGSPDLRALLGVGYSPRKHDQDADGVPDGDDFCVHLPEDRDGFQDDDGCADDDNDGDLIVDEDDRCPLEPAEVGADEDEDGCTDPR